MSDLYDGVHDVAPRLRLRALSTVEPEAVEWLWPPWIALGKITGIVGDPGAGKSQLSLAIAAAVTRGGQLPGDDRRESDPADVLLVNYEDGLADTIRPRAERCGANLERVHVIEGQSDSPQGEIFPFSLAHIPALTRELEARPEAKMLIIDPISALLAGVDSHKDAEVRSALAPLTAVAEHRRIAIVFVAHLNKSQATAALYRVGGSIGFVGLARSIILVGREQESGRRALASLKNNLAPQPEPVEFAITEDGIAWLGEAPDLDADRLLAAPPQAKRPRDEAKEFLRELLADGPMPKRDVDTQARRGDFSERTIRRAADDLGVIAEKRGYNAGWHWRLPGPDDVPQRAGQ